jgi:hypothetical protein
MRRFLLVSTLLTFQVEAQVTLPQRWPPLVGDKDPVQTKPHKDVKESIFGFSSVVPAGNYTGGALILYDLEMVIELNPETYSGSPVPSSTMRTRTSRGRGTRSWLSRRRTYLIIGNGSIYLATTRTSGSVNKSGSKKVLGRAKRLGKPAL